MSGGWPDGHFAAKKRRRAPAAPVHRSPGEALTANQQRQREVPAELKQLDLDFEASARSIREEAEEEVRRALALALATEQHGDGSGPKGGKERAETIKFSF